MMAHLLPLQHLSLNGAFKQGGTSTEGTNAIATDASGNVYVAGYTTGSTGWDADPSSNTNNVNPPTTSFDMVIAKYDGTLTPASTSFYKWAFAMGGSATDVPTGMALDGVGNIYLAGYTQSTSAWDADPSSHTSNVSSSGSNDHFIAKYDGNLTPGSASFFKYAFTAGSSSSSDQLTSIAVGNGFVYIGGFFTGSNVDFQGGSGTSTLSSVNAGTAQSQFLGKYSEPLIWSGTTSTAWALGSNWLYGNPPTPTDYVSIPTSGTVNEPSLTSDITIAGLQADSGRTFTLGTGATLSVTGNITNNGTLTGGGKLSLTGSTAQTLSGSGTVGNIEINNSNGVTVSSATADSLKVTGLITLTSGTLTTNGKLVLKSTSPTSSAIVGPVPASGSGITGTVVHERYISAPANGSGGRSWRLLTSPIGNNPIDNSIYYNWQKQRGGEWYRHRAV